VDRRLRSRQTRRRGIRRLISPFYADKLTPAIKFKRVLFCRAMLDLPEDEFFAQVKRWVFWDEKWWDLFEPAGPIWVKEANMAEMKSEAKQAKKKSQTPIGQRVYCVGGFSFDRRTKLELWSVCNVKKKNPGRPPLYCKRHVCRADLATCAVTEYRATPSVFSYWVECSTCDPENTYECPAITLIPPPKEGSPR
jgi:hypothetical protein